MDKIEFVPIKEALSAKREVKKSKVVQEVEAKLKELTPGQSGKIVAKTEKPQTVKNRVFRVVKMLGMKNVTVKRIGDVIYFYKEQEAEPKTRRK